MEVRVALAQLDTIVGDVWGNAERILDAWRRAHDQGADLVVFSELAVTGYPPEDLLLKPEFIEANLAAVRDLAKQGPASTVAVVGHVGGGGDASDAAHWDVAVSARDLHNSAAVLAEGRVVGTYHKWRLPNYGVFDEARYFVADDDPLVVTVAGVTVGVVVCEDLWTEQGPVELAARRGAQVIASLNASPYHRGKRDERERWLRWHVRHHGVAMVYVNTVGGQDEVVFDGDSVVVGPGGDVIARGAQFDEDLVVADVEVGPGEAVGPRLDGYGAQRPALQPRDAAARLGPVDEVWAALVRATRDYCHKNGFRDAVLGLSGGIDSAVTAAVAADALGADHVTGVGMASPFTSQASKDDAQELARSLGIRYETIGIEPAMRAFESALADLFAGTGSGIAEENIQARIRGLLLMALSNKFGSIVLTTGNKSEAAVGYATLYGDMAGGFSVLKDVSKTLVYELARHRNERGPAVPISTLDKAPTAELKPDQTDQDTLPPYDQLDQIIEAYVEKDLGIDAIAAAGHDLEVVRDVVAKIDAAEYKRRQAPPGVKITDRAFGKDRRVPITNHWRS